MLFSWTADFDEFHKLERKVLGTKNVKGEKMGTKLNKIKKCQSVEVLRVSLGLNSVLRLHWIYGCYEGKVLLPKCHFALGIKNILL